MRLSIERRLRPVQKLVLGLLKVMAGQVPGPVLLASYTQPIFGNGWAACMKEGMRRATEWSVGEVELFAAFVSRINSCGF
jgi:hypothetical protein